MKIPPYWAKETYEEQDRKGRPCRFTASGWSFKSMDEAIEEAKSRAKRSFEMISGGEKPKAYDYGDRPLKEEIIETVDHHGEEVGVITRNRYGALVLNTREVLFADVDFPEPEPDGFKDSLRFLFRPSKRKQKRQALQDSTLERIKVWAKQNPDRMFRLYRTLMGIRLLFTDSLYEPTSEETKSLMEELDADPFYRKLTYKQESFRARLTPKPWRCGYKRPPNAFPWSDSREEDIYRSWERKYNEQSSGYCACEFIGELGPQSENEKIRLVVELHDKRACGNGKFPLA